MDGEQIIQSSPSSSLLLFPFLLAGLEQVDKLEDSFEIVNSGTKPLAAYLFSNNKKLKEQFVACISAGGVVINDTTIHVRFLFPLTILNGT